MFFNSDPETQHQLEKLRSAILSDNIDETTLGPQTLKLRNTLRSRGIKNFRLTLNPDFRGTMEDIAAAHNKVEDYLSDPIHSLISRIEGYIFLKSDTIACLENRFNCKTMSKEPPTTEELYKINSYKEDIELLKRAIETIKDLNSKLKVSTNNE